MLHALTGGKSLDREIQVVRRRPVGRLLKTLMDYGLAGIGLVLMAPLMLVIALAIRLISPGPVLYAQIRVGRHGKPFKLWKFRTMLLDADRRLQDHLAANPAARKEWERSFKLKDDPRILPGLGRLLRRSSLDELPQLFNILAGDMSLVGPRPFPRYHLERFSDEFQTLRSSVKPGLTGLWQVTVRSDGDLGTQERLDTAYVEKASLWLDLRILLRTPVALLTTRGAY